MAAYKVLIYGYGNPGRQDDALGIKCVDYLQSFFQKEAIDTVDFDQNYQLNIEDAHRIAEYELVIFVDASVADIEHYHFEEITPTLSTEFSMHAVSPAFVTGLCQEIFGRIPVAYQFHIKGYEFEFMEEISEKAKTNLQKAQDFLVTYIKNWLSQ